MNTKIKIYSAILFLSLITLSCKKDEVFATKTAAAGDIIFQVPDAALPAVAAGQPILVQPSTYLVGARFSKTGNVTVTVNLSSNLTNLTVNLLTSAGVRQQRAIATGISGVTTLTFPMTTLGLNNAAVTTSVLLEFVGSNSDNTLKATRVFTVTAF